MRRLSRKRLPVLYLGGLVKVAEGFVAVNSMIWRQSPSATRSSKTGARGPCGSCERAITQGRDFRHGWRFMLRWDWACGCECSGPGRFDSCPRQSVRKLIDFRSGWPVVQNAGNFCDSPRCVAWAGFLSCQSEMMAGGGLPGCGRARFGGVRRGPASSGKAKQGEVPPLI
jgi:hypothetical protein